MDVRTLVVVLGITHVIQLLALTLEASVSRAYKGIGWWLLWSAAALGGFVFILLRSLDLIGKVGILGQNGLLILGVIFLYVGIVRFLGRRERPALLITGYALFLAALAYFAYVDDEIAVRVALISLAFMGVALLTAWTLWRHAQETLRATALFLAAVFLLHAGIFAYRAAMVALGADVHDMFSPNLLNVAPYLDGILVGLLWTIGLIIMVHQRLHGEMREAKEHFELLFNTIPDAVIITRLEDGRCREVNEGFTALSGYRRAEVLGHTTLDLHIWADPEDRRGMVQELKTTGFCENVELQFGRKDGSRFDAMMSSKKVTLEGVSHVLSVVRDISQRKRAEEEVRRLNADLEERVRQRTAELTSSNRELETFAYSIAHDLRQPLRGIDGWSHALLEEFGPGLDETGRGYLKRVRNEAQTMGHLIDALLELSKVARGPLTTEAVDMAGVARSVAAELRAVAPSREVEFVLSPALGGVRADPVLLRLILSNLLRNAWAYTEGAAHPRVELGVFEGPPSPPDASGTPRRRPPVYFVRDNGAGFNMVFAANLFRPFERLHSGPEGRGAGIGLASVQRAIQKHGGQIWAEGEEGKGATFYFTLEAPEAGDPDVQP